MMWLQYFCFIFLVTITVALRTCDLIDCVLEWSWRTIALNSLLCADVPLRNCPLMTSNAVLIGVNFCLLLGSNAHFLNSKAFKLLSSHFLSQCNNQQNDSRDETICFKKYIWACYRIRTRKPSYCWETRMTPCCWKNGVTLKVGVEVTQDHSKCHHSVAWVWFPIWLL